MCLTQEIYRGSRHSTVSVSKIQNEKQNAKQSLRTDKTSCCLFVVTFNRQNGLDLYVELQHFDGCVFSINCIRITQAHLDIISRWVG